MTADGLATAEAAFRRDHPAYAGTGVLDELPTEHVQSMLRVVRVLWTEIAAPSLAIRRYARTDPRVELLCQLRGIARSRRSW